VINNDQPVRLVRALRRGRDRDVVAGQGLHIARERSAEALRLLLDVRRELAGRVEQVGERQARVRGPGDDRGLVFPAAVERRQPVPHLRSGLLAAARAGRRHARPHTGCQRAVVHAAVRFAPGEQHGHQGQRHGPQERSSSVSHDRERARGRRKYIPPASNSVGSQWWALVRVASHSRVPEPAGLTTRERQRRRREHRRAPNRELSPATDPVVQVASHGRVYYPPAGAVSAR
jgi:hypothetical protein